MHCLDPFLRLGLVLGCLHWPVISRSAKPDRPAVYQHIVAHLRQMAEQYGFWPRLPSQKWSVMPIAAILISPLCLHRFYYIFTDHDEEQAEFKKELVRLLWQWVAGRAKSEVLGPDLMAGRAASLTWLNQLNSSWSFINSTSKAGTATENFIHQKIAPSLVTKS